MISAYKIVPDEIDEIKVCNPQYKCVCLSGMITIIINGVCMCTIRRHSSTGVMKRNLTSS